MKMNILLILILFSYSLQIKEAVYSISYNNIYFKSNRYKIQVSNSQKYKKFMLFRIKKAQNNINESFYFIENIEEKSFLSLSKNFEVILNQDKTEESSLWKFIITKKNKYVLLNKKQCFLKFANSIIFYKNIDLIKASEFSFKEIYEEVQNNKIDDDIINKEPIDILIKYIDLRDPLLKREHIHQIKKDYDNEELKYSLRSILKYIPWVRKIFILMPNEKVRFLKNYDLINEKIIYVNDKEFLGYHSSNCRAFLYRYWKMEKYGISKNIIIMDDDYFIGSYLNKSNFFYVDNGKVIPAIINSEFTEIENIITKKKYKRYKKLIDNSKEEQTNTIFLYSQILGYSLLFKIFNKTKLIIPNFNHNAMPVNLDDLKKVFDLINQSEYKEYTLDSPYRHKNGIQFQSFVLGYTFLKYKRKVKNIQYKNIHISKALIQNYNTSLFCLNTGSLQYSSLTFMKAKILMEYLFPEPTFYEIEGKNELINLSYNTALIMEKEINKEQKKIIHMELIIISFCVCSFLFLLIFIFKKLANCYIINLLKIINMKIEIKMILVLINMYCIYILFNL
jgi:hypothetical protein